MAAKPKPANVFQFRPGLDALPETPLQKPLVHQPVPQHAEARPAALDLAGKAKVWFAIGSGNVGKTVMLRWCAETVDRNGGSVICVAADPGKRTFRAYRNDIYEPPSDDPGEGAEFLGELIEHLVQNKESALVDLGGGDTSLKRLLTIMPNLVSYMEGEGVYPVAMYVTTPDPNDLTAASIMEDAGFTPQATALVCNLRGTTRDEYDAVLQHSDAKRILSRGAEQLWMPNLLKSAAKQVDRRCIQYRDADKHLPPFLRPAVAAWLADMEREFAPIRSWMP